MIIIRKNQVTENWYIWCREHKFMEVEKTFRECIDAIDYHCRPLKEKEGHRKAIALLNQITHEY